MLYRLITLLTCLAFSLNSTYSADDLSSQGLTLCNNLLQKLNTLYKSLDDDNDTQKANVLNAIQSTLRLKNRFNAKNKKVKNYDINGMDIEIESDEIRKFAAAGKKVNRDEISMDEVDDIMELSKHSRN